MISLVRGTEWMRECANALLEVTVARDLIRGIQEYAHADICRLVESMYVERYPHNAHLSEIGIGGRQRLWLGCFLFHPVWKEWVFAASNSTCGPPHQVLVTCSILESPTSTSTWLAGQLQRFVSEYDGDEYDYGDNGVERSVEYVRPTDPEPRRHIIQNFWNIHGLMVDQPTGQLLVLDDDKIRLIRRPCDRSMMATGGATIANLFSCPTIADTKYTLLAFYMDSSTHALFVIYEKSRMLENSSDVIQHKGSSGGSSGEFTTTKETIHMAILQRITNHKQITYRNTNLLDTNVDNNHHVCHYSPTFVPVTTGWSFSAIREVHANRSANPSGRVDRTSSFSIETWRTITKNCRELTISHPIVIDDARLSSIMNSVCSIVNMSDDDESYLLGIANTGFKRELISLSTTASVMNETLPIHPSEYRLYPLIDPIVDDADRLKSFEGIFVLPGTSHVYMTTIGGEIMVMGDLTRLCTKIQDFPCCCPCSCSKSSDDDADDDGNDDDTNNDTNCCASVSSAC